MRSNRFGKYQALVAALLILLAVLMIYSRGQRAAQRLQLRSSGEVDQGLDKLQEEPQTRHNMDAPSPFLPPSEKYLLGHVDPSADTLFVPVGPQYAGREGMFMHREAYAAFLDMHRAASGAGVDLVIVSAMRTFAHQKRIWENKWNGRQVLFGGILATSIGDPVERSREILRFSAMPGTSRHHWGTDIDLNALVNSYFESGEGRKVYEWLLEHAAGFGFCQPYTAMGPDRPQGYEEEKWHWSYKPVSSQYLRAYRSEVSYDDITGFDGWETAREIGVIEDYVLNIAADCR